MAWRSCTDFLIEILRIFMLQLLQRRTRLIGVINLPQSIQFLVFIIRLIAQIQIDVKDGNLNLCKEQSSLRSQNKNWKEKIGKSKLHRKGGYMSEKDLCVKCRDYYCDKYGVGVGVFLTPDQHCHHDEPKWLGKPGIKLEKKEEKCWCEMGGEKRIQLHDYIINRYGHGYYRMKSVEIPKYCPKCGKEIINIFK